MFLHTFRRKLRVLVWIHDFPRCPFLIWLTNFIVSDSEIAFIFSGYITLHGIIGVAVAISLRSCGKGILVIIVKNVVVIIYCVRRQYQREHREQTDHHRYFENDLHFLTTQFV